MNTLIAEESDNTVRSIVIFLKLIFSFALRTVSVTVTIIDLSSSGCTNHSILLVPILSP